MSESSQIDYFLTTLKLTKYKDKFIKEGDLHVNKVEDFSRFLKEPNVLKEAGMTLFEFNRFKRLCEETIKEIITRNEPVPQKCVNKAIDKPLEESQQASVIVSCDTRSLKLKLKFLNKGVIMSNKVYPLEVNGTIKYYEFVREIYQVLSKEVKGGSFNSVELYSQTGYPLATTPSVYLQPLSNWGLQDGELVYAYPKRLFKDHTLECNVDCDEFEITIQMKDSCFKKSFRFNKQWVFYIDLKTLLSSELHIIIHCIQIYHFNFINKCEEIAPDNFGVKKNSIDKRKLSFTISDTYNTDELFSAFKSQNTLQYLSEIIPEPDSHAFNAYLLYLVMEYKENRDKDRLLRKLGLLRKISCSPPLVYALYLLFTDSPTSLPHTIAVNQGIITTTALLSSTTDPPNLSKFPQLWMHLEEHALTPDLQLTEIYETTFISKRTRENPRDVETRRLLQAFPPNQDTIITWRNVPSTHVAFSYTPPTRLEDFTEGVKYRFPMKHPVELYKNFTEEKESYGLMLPLTRGLSSPCVFLGRTEGRYGYFNYFSPEDGECHSYSPHDINIAERLEISNMNSYPKIIIVLDISRDMSQVFREKRNDPNEPDYILSQLDAALILIQMLIDSLIGSQCKYLLGVIIMSSNHDIPNGFYKISDPTFEYCVVWEKTKDYIERFKPSYNRTRRLPNGIILNALQFCIDNYPSSSKGLRTEIFLFTNCETILKYHGAKMNLFEQRLHISSCVINNIILGNQFAHDIEKLCKITKGQHVSSKLLSMYISMEYRWKSTAHPILQYASMLQGILSNANIKGEYFGSYNLLTNHLAHRLISTEEFLDKSEKDEEEYQKAMKSQGTISNCIHILRNVTAYIKNPNPHCKLYPFRNEILSWIVFIQGPPQSPLENSMLIMEICFGELHPLHPPKLRFLSSAHHPNVDRAGNVCHPILIEDYSPTVSIRQILDAIHSMLTQPIITHAVSYEMMELTLWKKEIYDEIANSSCKILGLQDKTFLTIEQDFKIKSDTICISHPPALVCPITKQLFDNPVMTPEGNTYERHAILQHIEKNQTDLISSTPLFSSDLMPHTVMVECVLKYRNTLLTRTYWWEK